MGKLSLSNIKEFIEGNVNMLEDEILGKPLYYKEQILYRKHKCQDCYRMGACLTCGCALPGKHYVERSCNNGLRFPDLMNEEDWEKYKQDNRIKITLKLNTVEIDLEDEENTDSL
jgi:hypothetical protein